MPESSILESTKDGFPESGDGRSVETSCAYPGSGRVSCPSCRSEIDEVLVSHAECGPIVRCPRCRNAIDRVLKA